MPYPLRRCHRRATLSLAFAATLGLALPAGAALAPGDTLPAAPLRWWAPFGDRVLDGLMVAAGGQLQAQQATAQAYVGLRTLQARESLLRRLCDAGARQREAAAAAELPAGAAPGTRERLLAALDARSAPWRGALAALQAELDRAETQLGALVRRDRTALREALAHGAGRVPEVAMNVPFHLPAAVGASPAALPALQASLARAQRAGQLLQAGELSLRAVELRQQAGAESPMAVLEAYQQMLALADDAALAQGALAMAWAELLPAAAPYVTARAATPAPQD